MSEGQRIFRGLCVFAIGVFAVLPGMVGAGERYVTPNETVSFEVPDGWEESDLNKNTAVAGFASWDNATSAYLVRFDPGPGSFQEILDNTIGEFEKQFVLSKESDAKTGQVQGPGEKQWPAIFKTLEGTVKKGEKEFQMRFYLLIFDVGTDLYMVQATTTLPVRDVRERQIYELIRSIVAKGRNP